MPAQRLVQPDRERRKQELPERARRRADAERERAPVYRQQFSERADHDGEGGAREPETDQEARGQDQFAL